MLKKYFGNIVKEAVNKLIEEGAAQNLENAPDFVAEIPKNTEFGDFAVNVSSLSKFTRKAPPVTAQEIIKHINSNNFEVNNVGGFINFKVKSNLLSDVIKEINEKNLDFASTEIGKDEKVILEYVSANPTGPFHIGHGRWAAVGSALANILKKNGFDVWQEFYVNDAGSQIQKLGNSLYIRVLQENGVDIDFPFDDEEAIKSYYVGDYLIDCAKNFIKDNPEFAKGLTEYKNLNAEDLDVLSQYAKKTMLNKQKELLEEFKTFFDEFYFETSLHESGKVKNCLKKLKEQDMLYENDNALWFRSSKYGDEQDRVIIKADGKYTYLTADIAYHFDKLERGFTKLINIWGADHHGYIPRMKAAIQTLGYNPDSLEVLLGQLVNLSIKGEQVRMGKRTKMITLDDLIDEVGIDATRYWMIMRNIDNTLEFDVDLAKSKTDENPVFYVQYAHARACSVLRNATEERFDTVDKVMKPAIFDKEYLDNTINGIKDYSSVIDNEEQTKRLILKLEEYKSVVENSAITRSPYLITKYLQELAANFHKFYASTRVLTENKEQSILKLGIVKAVITVLKSGLDLIAVSAPERM